MSGYDLRHYTQTFNDSNKANGSSSAIINKYPFVCSREALYAALNTANKSGAFTAQRNPNGYTVTQLTDKIIEAWDNIMFYDWDNTSNTEYGGNYGYVFPRGLQSGLNNGQNWADSGFWSFEKQYFVAYRGTGTPATGGLTAEDIRTNSDIILLPSFQYDISSTIYKKKPFWGLDTEAYIETPASSTYTKVGTNDYGNEADVDSDKRVTNITALPGATHDDPSNLTSSTRLNPQLLALYDFNFYHDNLNVHGSDFSVNPEYTGANEIFNSTKWFDLAVAKFTVTVSAGKVTAVTPAARNDGDGVSRTGGWGYSTDDDYTELDFVGSANLASPKLAPRVLWRTNTASDVSGQGQKATVDITDADSEFYAGSGLVTSDFSNDAYATGRTTSITGGFQSDPSVDTSTSFSTRNWPGGYDTNAIDPSIVRITHERPVLTTQSRSLKATTVGTGAHRLQFECEYPPIDTSVGERFIRAFEEYKGASQSIQLYIPNMAISHWEGYVTENFTSQTDTWTYYQNVIAGAQGSDTIVIAGHKPGVGGVPNGTYFTTNNNDKIYKTIDSSGNADEYGRVTYQIEPPLLINQAGSFLRSGSRYLHGDNSDGSLTAFRGKYFLVNVFLVDSTLDYTIDAAGHYRMSFKFRENI